ncbi:MAG: DNA polymerase III subunit gamma/tau [Sphingobacteriia bacterium 24-36-13]|jgi:DNA polymerase-3 subunit gamma/tau|uniref:DNA polymerase III subunit gamma/tau n=1 Tax=Sediminibacterium sp. TaxID=1917865 RepID=UPI000BD092C7|nr:DNA polymerase III subunit gamma/tau [Sediminibacterium sp.]OYY09303.1 MAG: DNA polymerase III subunit gamma/tau [Sphingobacteriia bacterium 35-36-14]OYZ54639.1 MAG: DNA polymerase III subunit gamma/tau [Sphingobacteriia bacterium 24-36-13]OZA64021.1 MAG: DNA polymerase III subunit gamma/tau [Sphingobacteriia bacterium 39-36-14]HQS24955.1 DNA polymerase III subunit gamma/tau [Sediminibacterium sp.]HQS35513.1 DNA polymerase III subunit gamma/tau [Sediminibacterium sp.]
MDNFIVSARKYRPQNFNTVVGQQHITTTLKNAIRNNQLAHAFLFCGPRGVGKTTCARILAKTINCTNQTAEGEACNTCNSCVSFDAGTSMNIHELDAASNNSVDDIRALVEQVRFAPQAGKYKVYIVDEVHMLSSSAFNAFLKTLEEPPPYAIFILATTEKHKILPTILSRCQIFDFKRITNNDTVEHLQEIVDKEQINAEKAALQVIAQKSEGCMRDSLSILDKIVSFTNGTVTYQNTLEHLNILDEDYFFQLLECMQKQDMAGAMLLFDQINRKGFEGDLVLNGFAEFIRNLLVCKDAKSASLLEVVEGMQPKYVQVAGQTSLSYLVSALNILNDTEVNYKMARNKRLHVELALIKLSFLQQAIDLTTDKGGVVKKKRIDGPIAFKTKLIQSLAPPTPPASAIQSSVKTLNSASQPTINAEPGNTNTSAGAKLFVAQTNPSSTEPVRGSAAPAPVGTIKTGPKKSLLEALKEKAGSNYDIEEVKEAMPLTEESLRAFWDAYIVQLEQQLKHSAVGTFRIASLEIESDIHFTVRVSAVTAQKFIESEKMVLIDQLQTQFNNRAINFTILVEEGEREDVPLHMRLNSKQKFERIAEQYPLVRELRDKLRLEIDY